MAARRRFALVALAVLVALARASTTTTTSNELHQDLQPSDPSTLPSKQQQQQLNVHADSDAAAATTATAAAASRLGVPLVLESAIQFVADVQWSELLNVTQYDLPAFAYATDWSAIGQALQAASLSTYDCLRLWGVFVRLAAVPVGLALSAFAEALLPHFIHAVHIGVEYVLSMDPVHQAAVALSVILTAVGIRTGFFQRVRLRYRAFKRRAELQYRSFLATLNATSRALAVLVPHVAFFTFAYVVLTYWVPDTVISVWHHDTLCSFLATGYPLLRTVLIVRHRRLSKHDRGHHSLTTTTVSTNEPAPTATRRPSRTSTAAPVTQRLARTRSIEALVLSAWRPYETILKYWVLWALATCTLSLVTLVVPNFILTYVTLPTAVCNVVLAWIHSPVTRGDIALYTLLSPLINPFANRLRDVAATTSDGPTNDNDAANFVMRTLVLFRVVPERHVHFFKDLWAQGPALAGLLFVFTPGFVTARGSLIVGFGFPAYVTMGALATKTTRRYEHWLCYFCVAVAFDYVMTAVAAEVPWLPLFYHMKLLLMMWLQFPYFCGAQRLFDTMFASVFVLPAQERGD